MKKTAKLVGERVLVDEFALSFCASPDGYHGDDTAVIRLTPDTWCLLTTDAGPKRSILSQIGIENYFEEGYFSATMSISDIVAMGGRPKSLLAAVILPDSFDTADFRQLLAGFKASCNDFGADFVGGDTKEGESLRIVSTAMGMCEGYAPIGRCGATPGDDVYISSAIGSVLASFIDAVHLKSNAGIKRASPPGERIRRLARERIVTACSDMSDGPIRSAEEIGTNSNVTVILDFEQIEIVRFSKLARERFDEWREIVIGTGGCDFALLVTAAPDRRGELEADGWIRCGRVDEIKNDATHYRVVGASRRVDYWQHFSSTNSIVKRIFDIAGI